MQFISKKTAHETQIAVAFAVERSVASGTAWLTTQAPRIQASSLTIERKKFIYFR